MTLKPVPLPEPLQKGIDPAAPEEVRLAFARGDVPMSALERLGVLTYLVRDPSEKVREEADGAVRRLEMATIEKVLGFDLLHQSIIDLLADYFSNVSKILFKLVSHPNVGEKTLLRCSTMPDEPLLRTIAENSAALGKFPSVVGALAANPATPAKTLAFLTESHGIGGAVPVGAPKIAETADENPAQEGEASTDPVDEELAKIISGYGTDTDDIKLPDELMKEGAELDSSVNLYKLIQTMSIAEKIKLATLGSKGARKLLARDSNRTVVNAVIRSPKIREDEVLLIAQDKMTPDEIIFYILTKKEWLREYSLRLALAQNPKTPAQKAFRLLETLYDKDLKQIAKSRNVPQIISATARRVFQRRELKKG